MEKKYIDLWGAFFSRPVQVDSHRWNGWAVPYFNEEDLPELIKFINDIEVTGFPFSLAIDGVIGTHTDLNCHNPNTNEYLECVCKCVECVDIFRWIDSNGERVISVGGGSWCWSESSAEELAQEIWEWLENDAPTMSNFYDLLHEETYRTGVEFTEIEFIIGCSRWNGWELFKPMEFLQSINQSVDSAGWVNA